MNYFKNQIEPIVCLWAACLSATLYICLGLMIIIGRWPDPDTPLALYMWSLGTVLVVSVHRLMKIVKEDEV